MQIPRQISFGILGMTFVVALLNSMAPHHASRHRTRVINSPADYRYLHDPMYDLTPGLLRSNGQLINGLLPTYPGAQG